MYSDFSVPSVTYCMFLAGLFLKVVYYFVLDGMVKKMLRDEVGKDTVSSNVLSFLSDGWTYKAPENFGERNASDRLPGPKKTKNC